jgi:CRP-like cAMP-binding protein
MAVLPSECAIVIGGAGALECQNFDIHGGYFLAELLEFGVPGLMDDMPPRLLEALRAVSTSVAYAHEQMIHHRGDRKPGLSIVRVGAVRMGNLGLDGRYHAIAVLGPGHCFGESALLAGLPRTHDAQAEGDAIIDQITKAQFDGVLSKEQGLRAALLANMAKRLHSALEFIDDFRSLALPARLGKLLRGSSLPTGGARTLAVTQDELAQALGVSRMSVHTALQDLENQGLIARRYGAIEILSDAALVTWIADQTQLAPLD